MPRSFLSCERDEPLLLPPDLRDCLPEDHLAWFVAYGVIAAGRFPDHATIARFRARHEDALGALFSQVLGLCVETGIASVAVVAVDGTKVAADASGHANADHEGIARGILGEAGRIDAEEDQLHGDRWRRATRRDLDPVNAGPPAEPEGWSTPPIPTRARCALPRLPAGLQRTGPRQRIPGRDRRRGADRRQRHHDPCADGGARGPLSSRAADPRSAPGSCSPTPATGRPGRSTWCGKAGRIPLVQRPLRELTLLWHGKLVQRVTDPQEPVT